MSNYANYDDVVNQLRAADLVLNSVKKSNGGIAVGELYVESSKSVRCTVASEKKNNTGAYWLHELRLNDGIWLTGAYWLDHGNSSFKLELRKTCAKCGADQPLKSSGCISCGSKQTKAREIPPEQLEAHKKRMAEARRQAEAEAQADAERAAAWANAVWLKCREVAAPGEHDYLTRKNLKSAHGTRLFESNDGIMLEGAEKSDYEYLARFHGALVVPMLDKDAKRRGLQFILSREKHKELISKNDGRDKEYWPRGMLKQGLHYIIGGQMRGIGLVAEGFATAASLHEAANLPVAVAFDANNLGPVGETLWKASRKRVKLLYCADDDWLQKCDIKKGGCGKITSVDEVNCKHCGKPHNKSNAGVDRAKDSALATSGAWVIPQFSVARLADKKGPTDFNDLRCAEGEQAVGAQIAGKIAALEWNPPSLAMPARGGVTQQGGGELAAMPSMLSVDEAVARYWGTYGLGGKVLFDAVEYRLVHRDDVMNLIPERSWNDIKRHEAWRVARDTEIGFDPTEADKQIKCNLFSGWPTVPKQGKCSALLELLEYLCSNDDNSNQLYQWVLKWLAYPIQHRGAKMHSAIVVHGRQGTGKSRFFEAYGEIFGEYHRVLGQEALEDKFNSDWSEKKLFILADEVLARQDMYHIKNRLKGFITGGTIRVNPKGVAAHNEKNQMNIVFLSNERQPLVLENDDRRHCVIWVPPKLSDEFFASVNDEIDNGGVAALHHYLLNLDLADFKPWTKPPMTQAKAELIELSLSSEERFIAEWQRGELEGSEGKPLPFCPCLGSHLYREYERWCDYTGERKRAAKDLISFCGKNTGWNAGASTPTWTTLINKQVKNRKMVIPSEMDISESLSKIKGAHTDVVLREKYSTKAEWLTACFFEFANASGVTE